MSPRPAPAPQPACNAAEDVAAYWDAVDEWAEAEWLERGEC